MAKSNRNLKDDHFDPGTLKGQESDIGTLGIPQSGVQLAIFAVMLAVALLGPLMARS